MDEKMREADMQKQYQKLADAVGDLLDFIADGNPVDTNCTPYLVMQKEYFNSVNAGFVEEYGDPMGTVEINRAEAEWRRNQIVVTREHDKNERIIKSFCDYIWKTFKKDEGKQCFDEGELGYFTGRYIRMKTIVESDKFKKLESLLEEE